MEAATIAMQVEFTLANYHAGVYLSLPHELHRSPPIFSQTLIEEAHETDSQVDTCQLFCCLKSFHPAHRASLSDPWTGVKFLAAQTSAAAKWSLLVAGAVEAVLLPFHLAKTSGDITV